MTYCGEHNVAEVTVSSRPKPDNLRNLSPKVLLEEATWRKRGSDATWKRPRNPANRENQSPKYLTPVELYQPNLIIQSILPKMADMGMKKSSWTFWS